jgi:methyl-accepting chemotaxis protein
VNVKIKTKLVGGFMISAMIVAIVGAIGWYGTSRIIGSLQNVGENRIPAALAMGKIYQSATAIRVCETCLINRRLLDPAFRKQQYDIIDKSYSNADDAIKIYAALPKDPEEQSMWNELSNDWKSWKEIQMGIVDGQHEKDQLLAAGLDKDDPKVADLDAKILGIWKGAREKFLVAEGSLTKLIDFVEKQSMATVHNGEKLASSVVMMIIVGLLAGIVISLTMGLVIANSIVKPVYQVVDMIKDIAQGEGDLTKRLHVSCRDEICELATWFNTFVDKLHDIISQVAYNTEQLASAATEISSSAEQLSTGAKEQTNQTSQVSAAVEEMTATIVESAKNTAEASEKAKSAAEISQEGSRHAADTSNGMKEIVNSSNVTAKNIEGLAIKATAIGEIIKVIDDIADQTNLLALNAAIEAARAGEQGRGFAVVADEVRKLAERTTKATKEVAETIKGIQVDVSVTNNQITDSQKYVSVGRELVDKTNNSLTEIYSSIETVQEMMRQLATASEEQSAAAEQIAKSIESVNRITKESAAGTEQAASASEQLNRQAEELRKLVGGFKLRKHESVGV